MVKSELLKQLSFSFFLLNFYYFIKVVNRQTIVEKYLVVSVVGLKITSSSSRAKRFLRICKGVARST